MIQMNKLSDIYRNSFFKNRRSLNWRDSLVCDPIIEILKPSSVVDVGCGDGAFVKYFNDKGILSHGIEGSTTAFPHMYDARKWVDCHDLRTVLPEDFFNFRQFDLCMSLEVAEHIEPEYVDVYLDTLCSLSDRVLISAAPPGQGGTGHYNCQPQAYWDNKFLERGYGPDELIRLAFRRMWEPYKTKKGVSAYWQNIIYYEKV